MLSVFIGKFIDWLWILEFGSCQELRYTTTLKGEIKEIMLQKEKLNVTRKQIKSVL